MRWYAGRSHPQGGSVPLTNTEALHPPPAHTEQASEDLTQKQSFHTLTEKCHYVGILFSPQNAGEHNIAAFVTLIQIVWPYFFNISYFFIFSLYFPLHYLKSYWSIKSNQ